jgi:hypothetical protein
MGKALTVQLGFSEITQEKAVLVGGMAEMEPLG